MQTKCNFKFLARDLNGQEVYGDLAGDGKSLVRPGVRFTVDKNSIRRNPDYSGDGTPDFNLKFLARGTATGYRNFYKKGQVYYGYPHYNTVEQRFDIFFEDEHGENFVDVDQASIQRYIATDKNDRFVMEGDTLIVIGYVNDEGEVVGFRDVVKCTATLSNLDDIEHGIAFKDVKGAEQVELNIA